MRKTWILVGLVTLVCCVVAVAQYSATIYMKQGGTDMVIGNGGTVTVESGGDIAIESGGVLNAAAASGLKINSVAFTGTVRAGQHTCTSDEATNNTAVISTGLTSVSAHLIQILRSGAVVTGDAVVSESSGTISVLDGASTYAVTASDVINWLAVGT